MNNKHLSWYKEIYKYFFIASRAYFLQYEHWILDGINYTYGAHIEQDQLCAQNTGTKSYFYVDAHKLYISLKIGYNWFLFYISTEIARCSYSWINFPAWSNYTCAY